MLRRLVILCGLLSLANLGLAKQASHTFTLGTKDFLLDGKPFQVRSGEMHPERIPAQYWRHRIQMTKALGLNTIALYVFWNAHEQTPGKYDFKTGNLDLAKFIRTCQEEGMWVILRPGPYCCGEWDLGGIPPYLLKKPDIKIRSMDPTYIKAVKNYFNELAKVVKPTLVKNGGPVLLVQLENEYGSYSNDRNYIKWLHDTWISLGIEGPFYTSDGPTSYMLEAGSYPGCAVGLDSGSSEADWDIARKMNPGVPIMSGETYPGWLTHWGEKWATNSTANVVGELDFLMKNKKSFNFYVIHGGTNFGFTAGANSGGKGYEPDITSYDYDAPIGEQGNATPKYNAMREYMAKNLGSALPPVPAAIPTIAIDTIRMDMWTSIWEQLPAPKLVTNPLTFEAVDQNQGLILYRTKLVGHHSGRLNVQDLHDYATVFIDGKFLGTLDRREGRQSIEIPANKGANSVLEILVEGMGHINFSNQMIDRKGITNQVLLNGTVLTNWEMYPLPLKDQWVSKLESTKGTAKPGTFHRGVFNLDKVADTFIDVSNYQKGTVWVNGHNLGRYWNIGPQTRLYCPANWLKAKDNVVLVLDLLQVEAKPLSGKETLGN
ncbi:MAG: glycoside hydrolase family 35 protein [Armatimonadota bacterium]